MPVTGIALPSERNLGRQSTVVESFFDKYTSTGVPAAPAPQYLVTDGVNGSLYWYLFENNVAGSGAILIEGAHSLTRNVWMAVGFYLIVSAGVGQAAPARSVSATTLSQNGDYVLQMLDAYPYMRARVTANGSSASLSALLYGVPN